MKRERLRWLIVWGLGVLATACAVQASTASDPTWLVLAAALAGLAVLIALRKL